MRTQLISYITSKKRLGLNCRISCAICKSWNKSHYTLQPFLILLYYNFSLRKTDIQIPTQDISLYRSSVNLHNKCLISSVSEKVFFPTRFNFLFWAHIHLENGKIIGQVTVTTKVSPPQSRFEPPATGTRVPKSIRFYPLGHCEPPINLLLLLFYKSTFFIFCILFKYFIYDKYSLNGILNFFVKRKSTIPSMV